MLARFLCFLLCATAALAQPHVSKVEPPNWWQGHSLNPVRLLISGSGLCNSKIDSQSASLRIGRVSSSSGCAYLFVDVEIARAAKPGPYSLRIEGPQGTTMFNFEILAPLARQNRFRGFSDQDVIYLIMPDRFANGDPSNDDPEISKGLFDRTRPRYYH